MKNIDIAWLVLFSMMIAFIGSGFFFQWHTAKRIYLGTHECVITTHVTGTDTTYSYSFQFVKQ